MTWWDKLLGIEEKKPEPKPFHYDLTVNLRLHLVSDTAMYGHPAMREKKPKGYFYWPKPGLPEIWHKARILPSGKLDVEDLVMGHEVQEFLMAVLGNEVIANPDTEDED